MSVMQIFGKQHDDGWRFIKPALGPSDREALSFIQNAEGTSNCVWNNGNYTTSYRRTISALPLKVASGSVSIPTVTHRFRRQSETPPHPSLGLKSPIIYEFTI